MSLPRGTLGCAALAHGILSRKFLVFDPLRNDRVDAKPAHFVFFVVLEIAFEPFDVALALEGKDMSGDAIEEPAIVADDDGAAGEIRRSAATDCPLVIIAPIALVDVWMMMFDDRHPLDLKSYFDAHLDLVLNGLLAKAA